MIQPLNRSRYWRLIEGVSQTIEVIKDRVNNAGALMSRLRIQKTNQAGSDITQGQLHEPKTGDNTGGHPAPPATPSSSSSESSD